jgi:hypothetical protein
MTKTCYIHIHVPKNAGSTFNAILARRFGGRYLSDYKYPPGYILSEAEKREYVLAHPECECIGNHVFRFPGPPLPEVTYRYLTFLRHPVPRLVSLYAYERKTSDPSHCSHRPLEEWLDIRLTSRDSALTNYQTYHICGLDDPVKMSFDLARRTLEQFDFVGILEDFDNSLLLLARSLGWPLDDLYYRKVNETKSESTVAVNSQTRQRILDLNQLDLQLYEYGLERHRRNLSSMSRARLALDRFAFGAVRSLPRKVANRVSDWRRRLGKKSNTLIAPRS